jgi:hypothetical protein
MLKRLASAIGALSCVYCVHTEALTDLDIQGMLLAAGINVPNLRTCRPTNMDNYGRGRHLGIAPLAPVAIGAVLPAWQVGKNGYYLTSYSQVTSTNAMIGAGVVDYGKGGDLLVDIHVTHVGQNRVCGMPVAGSGQSTLRVWCRPGVGNRVAGSTLVCLSSMWPT